MKLVEAIELVAWASAVWEQIAQETGLTTSEVQEVVERWEKERQERETLAKQGIALGHAPCPPYSLCIHEWRMIDSRWYKCSKCGEYQRAFGGDFPTSPRSPNVEVWIDE